MKNIKKVSDPKDGTFMYSGKVCHQRIFNKVVQTKDGDLIISKSDRQNVSIITIYFY